MTAYQRFPFLATYPFMTALLPGRRRSPPGRRIGRSGDAWWLEEWDRLVSASEKAGRSLPLGLSLAPQKGPGSILVSGPTPRDSGSEARMRSTRSGLRTSHGDDDPPSDASLLQVSDGRRDFAEGKGPIEDRSELPRLQQVLQQGHGVPLVRRREIRWRQLLRER